MLNETSINILPFIENIDRKPYARIWVLYVILPFSSLFNEIFSLFFHFLEFKQRERKKNKLHLYCEWSLKIGNENTSIVMCVLCLPSFSSHNEKIPFEWLHLYTHENLLNKQRKIHSHSLVAAAILAVKYMHEMNNFFFCFYFCLKNYTKYKMVCSSKGKCFVSIIMIVIIVIGAKKTNK